MTVELPEVHNGYKRMDAHQVPDVVIRGDYPETRAYFKVRDSRVYLVMVKTDGVKYRLYVEMFKDKMRLGGRTLKSGIPTIDDAKVELLNYLMYTRDFT